MSPLLGSSGGSSEYAYRGTLDDWPNDFASSLSSQNLTSQYPSGFYYANLTITGLNYKARVIVENANAKVAIISENGISVPSPPYVSAKETDSALIIRDNTVLSIQLEPTSGTLNDFAKTYTVPVRVGKRRGTWTVNIRSADNTPNTFGFTPATNLSLGIGVTSNTVTISGLEPGYSFPISISVNDGLGNIGFFKNNSGPVSIGTVSNSDQIYLSATSSNFYSTARVITIQVGTFSTTWSLLTRTSDLSVDPFSFTGISSANILGAAYTSNIIQISGADPGPTNQIPDPTRLPVSISGPNAFYEIRKSDNTLRYTDPVNPLSPNYWQNGTSSAFNGDKVAVKLNASSSYSTTTVGILTISNQSSSYIVTTRPAPIDTVPAPFSFLDLINQSRGVVVTSASLTLSGMLSGSFGTASITNSTVGIGASFQVRRAGVTVKPYSPASYPVQNGDVINLSMTTPNDPTNSGVTNSFVTFRVDGTDTTQNFASGDGYQTLNLSQEDTWNVVTATRTCSITPFTLQSVSASQLNFDNTITFTPTGYNTDCQMIVSVTSNSSSYDFVAVSGTPITPTKSLSVAPGSSITLRVRSSINYATTVTSTVTVSNSTSGVTPSQTYSTDWNITTVNNTSPASISFSATPSTVEVNNTLTLNWTSVNCTSVRSVSWTPSPASTTVNGSANVIPSSVGTATYTISLYANPFASNYANLPSDSGGGYVESTVTVTVTEDRTPTFTPTNFTNQTGVEITTNSLTPNVLTSNSMIISSITTPFQGIITGDAGASFSDGTTSKTLPNNSSFQLRVNASTEYSTTTSATLTIRDDLGNQKSVKTFSATTRACSRQTFTQIFPNISNPTYYVTLRFHGDILATKYPSFTNVSTGLIETYPLLDTYFSSGTNPTTGGPYANGTASNYYNLILGSPNGFWNGDSINGVITWDSLLGAIYSRFRSNNNRQPSQTEVNTLLNNLATTKPSSYTSLANYTSTDLQNFAAGSPIRNLSLPILDNCGAVLVAAGSLPP